MKGKSTDQILAAARVQANPIDAALLALLKKKGAPRTVEGPARICSTEALPPSRTRLIG